MDTLIRQALLTGEYESCALVMTTIIKPDLMKDDDKEYPRISLQRYSKTERMLVIFDLISTLSDDIKAEHGITMNLVKN